MYEVRDTLGLCGRLGFGTRDSGKSSDASIDFSRIHQPNSSQDSSQLQKHGKDTKVKAFSSLARVDGVVLSQLTEAELNGIEDVGGFLRNDLVSNLFPLSANLFEFGNIGTLVGFEGNGKNDNTCRSQLRSKSTLNRGF